MPRQRNCGGDLEQQGTRVSIHSIDIANEAQVRSLLDGLSTRDELPLRGIMHTAAVLDDAPLLNLDPQRLERVFGAKARGAWYLHRCTETLPLDYFVLFSSVSAIIGNAAQGNYVAANCFLDSLAHHRRQRGLAGLSVNWGALGDVGMAATSQQLEDYLMGIGMRTFPASAALSVFKRVLRWGLPQVGIMDIDWPRWKQVAPTTAALPRFSVLASGERQRPLNPELQALREELSAMSHEHQLIHISDRLAAIIAKILRLPIDRIDRSLSLNHLGVDSLMGMELHMTVPREFGVEVGILELMQGGSLIQLADFLLGRMHLQEDSSPITPSPVSHVAPEQRTSHEEVLLQNLNSLNEDDIDRLLDQLLSVPN